MSALVRRLLGAVRALFGRRRLEQELDEELQAYLHAAIDDKVARGMSRVEATRQSRAELGSRAAIKDFVRDAGWESSFEMLWQDVRYACRALGRSPGFAAAAVFTLALGIGVNTAVFGLVNAHVWAKLPLANPDELVTFRWVGPNGVPRRMVTENAAIAGASGLQLGGTFPIEVFDEIQRSNRTLRSIMAVARTGTLNVVTGGRAEVTQGHFVSGTFFQGLGIAAATGRTILPADDAPSAACVAVLGHQYWDRRFGRDPDVVGTVLSVNGVPVTVVGIAAPAFRDVLRRGSSGPPDIVLSLACAPTIGGTSAPAPPLGDWWLTLIGRLGEGATLDHVSANFETAIDRAVEAHLRPANTGDEGAPVVPRLRVGSASRGISDPSQDLLERAAILAGIFAVLLVIVCVNLSSLLLSRFAGRAREVALRLALGATRARLLRLLLVESALIAGGGGALGLGVAWLGGGLLADFLFQHPQPATSPVNLPVLAFVAALTVLAAALSGVVPAMSVFGFGAACTAAARAESVLSRSRSTGRFVAAQVALVFPLLVVAGLFLQTMTNLRKVELGFHARNLALFTVDPALAGYERDRVELLYTAIEERLASLPGVRRVTFSGFGSSLLDGSGVTMAVGNCGIEMDWTDCPQARMMIVRPDFFDVYEIPIVRGRAFDARDAPGSVPVAIVSETFAHAFLGDGDPVGAHVQVGSRRLEVVGVARDTKVDGLREAAPPLFYESLVQRPVPSRRVIVRTEGDFVSLAAIEEAVRSVDPGLPLQQMSTLIDRIDLTYLATERTFTAASTLIGGLALLVAAVGVFGLVSYTVAQRTRDIGVRVALGAQRRDVVRLVTKDMLLMVGGGITVGVGLALGVVRLLEHRLFGLAAHDAATLAAAGLIVLAAAILASSVPVRRAIRVDPVVALRTD